MNIMNQDRWQALMNRLQFDANKQTFDELDKAYTQPHRRYHTTEHISAMLRHVDRVNDLLEQPSLVELAIWFHDAIYAPFSSTNEADSAVWAVKFLNDNGALANDADVVSDLIMATLHNSKVSNNDQALLVDIDLSILGTEPNVYQQFEKDIRFEYKRVPYFLYKKKRKEILKGFLDRTSVYQTAFFIDQYEVRARNNMKRALQQL